MKKVRNGFMFWVCILALLLTIAGSAFASRGIWSYAADCTYGGCKCTEFRSTDAVGKHYTCWHCGHGEGYHKRR